MRAALTQAGRLPSRFVAWWLGELGALAPAVLRRLFAGGSGSVCLEISGTQLVISRADEDGQSELARLDIDRPSEALRESLARVLAEHGLKGADVVLSLEQGQALRKSLDLPLAAEEGLAELLWFELDRQTPYRPEQARYDYRVAGRDPGHQRMTVELLVAPVEAVDGLLARAVDWGLQPVAVTVAGIDDPANPTFDLSGGDRAAPSRSGRLGIALLVLLAAGLLGAAVWLPLEDQRLAAQKAETALADARKQAVVAANLRDELDRRTKAGSFLIRRKGEAPMMTAVLADLTRLLPDDTWLFELHVRGASVRARGYAPAASSVLELIERGPAFRNASFTSPVTRVPGIEAERFDLSFELSEEQEGTQ
jgi:general secretion pathway protein L